MRRGCWLGCGLLLSFVVLGQTACSLVLSLPSPVAGSRSDGAVRLAAPPAGASDQNPAFSPDGSRLVFTRFDNGYNDGPAGLFLLDMANGQIARLTPEEDQDNVNLPGAAWNSASGRIVFSSDRMDSNDLWRIAPDGSDFRRVTEHAGQPWYFEPSWSPDGDWVVFEASWPGASEDGRIGRIWKVRADGSDLSPLTNDPAFDDRQPNWSPAGGRIVFQRRALPDGQWDIYTAAPDGSNLYNVTDTLTVDETDASWSPDGRCIVYSSDRGELAVPNIFVIPAAGGQPTRATFSADREDGAPSWSPDGTEIVFESHEEADEDSPSALWRIAAPVRACNELTPTAYLPIATRAASTLPPVSLAGVDDFLWRGAMCRFVPCAIWMC